jgi:integrase
VSGERRALELAVAVSRALYAAYGSLAADAGASSIYIQTQMGHREARTTARYLHPDRLAHREEAARVAGWWREAAK